LLRVRLPCTTVASSTRRRTRCISSATGVVVPTQYSLQCTRLEPVVVPVEEAADTVCLNRATRSTTRSSHLQHVPRYNGVHVGEIYSGGGLGIERHRLLTREAPCQQTRFNLSFSKQWLAVANQSVSVSGLSFFSVCDFTVSVLQGFIYNYIAAVFFDTYLPAGFSPLT